MVPGGSTGGGGTGTGGGTGDKKILVHCGYNLIDMDWLVEILIELKVIERNFFVSRKVLLSAGFCPSRFDVGFIDLSDSELLHLLKHYILYCCYDYDWIGLESNQLLVLRTIILFTVGSPYFTIDEKINWLIRCVLPATWSGTSENAVLVLVTFFQRLLVNDNISHKYLCNSMMCNIILSIIELQLGNQGVRMGINPMKFFLDGKRIDLMSLIELLKSHKLSSINGKYYLDGKQLIVSPASSGDDDRGSNSMEAVIAYFCYPLLMFDSLNNLNCMEAVSDFFMSLLLDLLLLFFPLLLLMSLKNSSSLRAFGSSGDGGDITVCFGSSFGLVRDGHLTEKAKLKKTEGLKKALEGLDLSSGEVDVSDLNKPYFVDVLKYILELPLEGQRGIILNSSAVNIYVRGVLSGQRASNSEIVSLLRDMIFQNGFKEPMSKEQAARELVAVANESSPHLWENFKINSSDGDVLKSILVKSLHLMSIEEFSNLTLDKLGFVFPKFSGLKILIDEIQYSSLETARRLDQLSESGRPIGINLDVRENRFVILVDTNVDAGGGLTDVEAAGGVDSGVGGGTTDVEAAGGDSGDRGSNSMEAVIAHFCYPSLMLDNFPSNNYRLNFNTHSQFNASRLMNENNSDNLNSKTIDGKTNTQKFFTLKKAMDKFDDKNWYALYSSCKVSIESSKGIYSIFINSMLPHSSSRVLFV